MAHPRDVKHTTPVYEGLLGDGNSVVTKRVSSTRVVRYFVREGRLTQAWVFDLCKKAALRYYKKTIWFPDEHKGLGDIELPSDVLSAVRHHVGR
jgi:hypothetical protein